MRLKALIAAAVVALALAPSASTKTITGTPRNDNLRGTSGADLLNGRAGNDTIRGLAGDDRLIGGPGNDRLYGNAGDDSYSCGAGRDVVYADEGETVSGSCEVVHRQPAPPPPALSPPGHYAAPGDFLSFDVNADGRTVSNFFVRLLIPCQPSTLRLSLPLTVPTSTAIQGDKTFSIDYTFPDGFRAHMIANGNFDGAGNAAGYVTVSVSTNLGATHYDCQGSLPWSAARR